MISQFEFNHLKSNDDFGLTVIDVIVGYPSVNVVSVSVPFMNGSYDFSSLYGGQTYSNRTVKIKMAIEDMADASRTRLNILYDRAVNWLYSAQLSTLKIDYIEHLFTGRVTEVSSKEIFINTESIEVTFDCHPLRVSEYEEGNDIWDIFNFEADVAQETEFNVVQTKVIKLINLSVTSITPTVICNSEFDVVINNRTYRFPVGTSRDYRFNLLKGENELILNGTGKIEFKFRKEVI